VTHRLPLAAALAEVVETVTVVVGRVILYVTVVVVVIVDVLFREG
jgi:hypothetical protein